MSSLAAKYVLLLTLLLGPGAAPAAAAVLPADSGPVQAGGEKPAPGSLVLPDDDGQDRAGQPQDQDRRCMTVCGRWGEECAYVNRGAGGLTKKCRRTCKQYTEECF